MAAARLPPAVRVYYDFETTGFLPAGRVVQFGAVCEDREFSQLVNPGMPIPPNATAVHRIADAAVADAPPFAAAWREFLRFVDAVAGPRPALLLGYNSWGFDDRVLRAELARCGLAPAAALGERQLWTADVKRAVDEAVRRGSFRRGSLQLGSVYAAVLGRPLEGAHEAVADCRATLAVAAAFEDFLTCSPFAELGCNLAERTVLAAPPALPPLGPGGAPAVAAAEAAEAADAPGDERPPKKARLA